MKVCREDVPMFLHSEFHGRPARHGEWMATGAIATVGIPRKGYTVRQLLTADDHVRAGWMCDTRRDRKEDEIINHHLHQHLNRP